VAIPGRLVDVRRDYDSIINRNSIAIATGELVLGYLPWDLSIALAPEIDAGLAVAATARGFVQRAGRFEFELTLHNPRLVPPGPAA
jgi:hypothetical protein